MTIKIRRDAEISDVDGGWFRALALLVRHVPRSRVRALRLAPRVQRRPAEARRDLADAPHRDIEGLTYVVEGTFRHEDDVGGRRGRSPRVGPADDAQSGSEPFGAERERDRADAVHPDVDPAVPSARLEPGVEQKVFTEEDRTDRLLKVISGDGGDAVLVHQDAHVFPAAERAGEVAHDLGAGRGVYLYVIEGAADVAGSG